MPFSGTSALLLCGMRTVCNYYPILRVLKLKWSYSYYEPDSLEALAFLRLSVIRTDFIALATRAFSSSPSAGRFLAPWNLTRPALSLWAVHQVDFMALDCAIMNLHKFISLPGPFRGHTCDFFFLVFFLVAPSSEEFAARFDPLIYADLADWWRSLDWLFVLFWW